MTSLHRRISRDRRVPRRRPAPERLDSPGRRLGTVLDRVHVWRRARGHTLAAAAYRVLLVTAARSRPREAGMTTAEYAVGTLAAVAFAVTLIAVVKSDAIRSALTAIITTALGKGT